ncbi:MAG TPA: PQQ-dependent sugar dehydrogenase [Vicinamibacterales bacterium]|nr:PQQ-dependent sugar dehydrogenase [Vicinamibacterales bacterium]
MKKGQAHVAARTLLLAVVATIGFPAIARAQSLIDPALTVSTVVSGLSQPISMAFIGPNDFLVTEKASGQVKRVTNGVVAGVVLDLAVNSNSERGLLGMALHPEFPAVPWVYLYNTESTTGADSNVATQVPLLGNRVDRFVWNGSTLSFDLNIIKLRAFQNDHNNVANPSLEVFRGNHNGGVLRFGPDGKLCIIIGDNGRRGWNQNNLEGPVPDDDFGGPEPDDAHLTGVILRLNDDGSTPEDNPFHESGEQIGRKIGGALGEEVGRNLQKVFAYGVRNSFGMTFDPKKGDLWTTENGGLSFDEVNHVPRGFNGGWIQFMGPLSRVAEFRALEIAAGTGANGPNGLQQLRYPATRISETPRDARKRLFDVPASHPQDPEFSWKRVVPPAALGFITGTNLGEQYDGDLIVGSAVARAANAGHLYRFRLNGGRERLVFNDDRLKDTVADNLANDDFMTEGEEILFGTNFGIVTDIQTGPDGNLYLVGPAGTVRRISKQ